MKTYSQISFLIIAIATITLSGCTPLCCVTDGNNVQELEIDVIRPARITVPKKVKKLLIVAEKSPDNDLQTDSLATEYVKQLAGYMKSSPRFTVAEAKLIDELNHADSALLYSKLETLCKIDSCQAVIVLEYIALRPTWIQNSYYDTHDLLVLEVITKWSLHIPDEGKVADNYRFTASKKIRMQNNKDLTPKEEKNRMIAQAIELSEVTSFKIGRRISPMWDTQKRHIVNRGSDDFRLAAKHVNNNEWEKANEIWLKISNGNGLGLSRDASYNMALTMEMQGNLEGAFATIEQLTSSVFTEWYIAGYQKALAKRMHEDKILEKQFGK